MPCSEHLTAPDRIRKSAVCWRQCGQMSAQQRFPATAFYEARMGRVRTIGCHRVARIGRLNLGNWPCVMFKITRCCHIRADRRHGRVFCRSYLPGHRRTGQGRGDILWPHRSILAVPNRMVFPARLVDQSIARVHFRVRCLKACRGGITRSWITVALSGKTINWALQIPTLSKEKEVAESGGELGHPCRRSSRRRQHC